MALLTAEDVLNKAFSKTKYREGFDQDEVDDFLDEVAQTISQLTAERDELAAKLKEAGTGAGEAPAPAASQESGLLAAATDPTPPTPTGMLAMAQKLHDEYVAAGEEEKERLIEEGKTKAEAIVERAEKDASARMDQLNAERSGLETKIDDLRRFERDYRSRLKAYLSNLLGDLEHAEGTAPAPAAPYVGEDLAGDDAPETQAEETTEAAFEPEESVEAESAAEETDAEEAENPFAPVTGAVPAVDDASEEDAPYTPPSQQFGTPYTPQRAWGEPVGEDDQRA